MYVRAKGVAGQDRVERFVSGTPHGHFGESIYGIEAGLAEPVRRRVGDRWGSYELRRGDSDTKRRYAGHVRRAKDWAILPLKGEHGFVEQLQRDLRELGFRLISRPDGVFGRLTEQAVREFQIHAKLRTVAEQFENDEGFADLRARFNVNRYTGSVSGVANPSTRRLLQHWLDNSLRCPVVIDAYRNRDVDLATGLPRPGVRPAHRNVWRSNQVTSGRFTMYARDFSDYYDLPAHRDPDDRIIVGQYSRPKPKYPGGPRSRSSQRTRPPRPRHAWPEAEIVPGMFFDDPDHLNPRQISTFKVVRAVSETECEGYLDVVNAWDGVFVSVGPCHWVLGGVSWKQGGGLGGLLSYLEAEGRPGWHQATRFFGVEPAIAWSDRVGPAAPGRQRLLNPSLRFHGCRLGWETEGGSEVVPRKRSAMNWFRTWHWFYRMVMAGRTVRSWQRACYGLARARLWVMLNTPWRARNRLPARTTLGDVFTSEAAVAALMRWHVRYPARIARKGFVGWRIEEALRDARRRGVRGDPSTWGATEEGLLIRALRRAPGQPTTLRNIFVWGGPRWRGLARALAYRLDPDALDPGHPTLRSERGSFRFDAVDMLSPIGPPI